MRRNRSKVATIVALVALLAAALLGGCAGRRAQRAAQPPEPAQLALMPAAEKAKSIAPSFPPQVPVPSGAIVSGEAQGDSAWDYTIVVSGSLASVREWYRVAYQRADWTVVAETPDSLNFEKSAAQSRATFTESVPGETTKVVVTVGVGTQVLQLQ